MGRVLLAGAPEPQQLHRSEHLALQLAGCLHLGVDLQGQQQETARELVHGS